MVERMVEYANEQEVQLLLLSGDLFDSGDIYGQTGEELALALGRFAGQVVIAPGNHDYYDPHGAYGRILWPENVHIFQDTALTELAFPENITFIGEMAFRNCESLVSARLPVDLTTIGNNTFAGCTNLA